MSVPSVSIILPTYNRARTLRRAAVSVLQQSFGDFELIIVDDASTDHTLDLIAELKDDRISVLRHPARRGGSAARNTGLAAARADWIAFQDSDDEWMPSKLEEQMNALTGGGDVCYTGLIYFDGKTSEYIPNAAVKNRQGSILDELLQGNFVSTQTLVVKHLLLKQAGGFDESLPRYQDWDLVIRLARNSPFVLLDRPLVTVYQTPGNISSHLEYDLIARERILQKYAEIFAAWPEIASDHYFALSRIASRLNKPQEARRFARAALTINPKRWKNWAVLADAHLRVRLAKS